MIKAILPSNAEDSLGEIRAGKNRNRRLKGPGLEPRDRKD